MNIALSCTSYTGGSALMQSYNQGLQKNTYNNNENNLGHEESFIQLKKDSFCKNGLQ